MQPDILNMYIDRLLQEIQELTKTRLLIETQLKYTEKINSELQLRATNLEEQLEKTNKKKTKEVNTSDTF